MAPAALSERLLAWQEAGASELVGGHAVHLRFIPGADPALVLLHGFPSSSYDFRDLLPLLGDHAILNFDFLGFGLSDKPRGYGYSLFKQADLAEELIDRHLAGRPCFVAAHDMGTSVGTELLARDLAGRGAFPLAGMLLFNGSIVLDRASLTPSQRLLRSPLGSLAARLSNERVFRQQFASLFSAAHPISGDELEDQWALLCHNGGRTLGHELIAYLDERVTFAERWHGAIRDWPGAFSLAWGTEDPVATVEVLAALRQIRPGVPVDELTGLGHYPQLEDPDRVAAAIAAAVGRSG